MSVLKEILDWSQERPVWQRDALRRLVVNGDLLEEDIQELTEICKAIYGLIEEPIEAVPLQADHIPAPTDGSAAVALESIFHHRGVNALAEDQTLKFSPNLTVVYGDNAAGKTGYIRILKSACRARGQEKILGNIVSGTTPFTPVVSIRYRVGTDGDSQEWSGDGEDAFVSRISVFDTQSAGIYLTEKTDVAFRPFGLDLFDKLVKACKAVRARLETEQRALQSTALTALLTGVSEGTAVARLLTNINSLTNPETVKALATLSPEEAARFALLEKSLIDLQANDPKKLVQQLNVLLGRVQSLGRHVNSLESALSDNAAVATLQLRTEGLRKSEEAKRLREATFPEGTLNGTGSETWTTLWEAAQQFSEENAYPGQTFPITDDGALCVLCQQNVDHAAAHRLRQFSTFVSSVTERELRELRDTFAQRRKTFVDLKTTTESVQEIVKEIRIDHEATADAITKALADNELRRKAIVTALTEEEGSLQAIPALVTVASKIDSLVAQIDARIKTLGSNNSEETRKQMTAELQELQDRRILAANVRTVLDEIERRKRHAAYGMCIEETKTQAITQKSTVVTRTAVTQRLKESFRDELKYLSFRHVEVELNEAGGTEGVLYHKLTLTRAPGVELPKVVSEGEQRCLSIAAFFAELSTADDPSGIVFDDPVSSLDYKWREGVAHRLVLESKKRQVVVFTHDVVFLLLLKQCAEHEGVKQLDQHVRQLSKGAGVCADELPWVAMPIKQKIGFLKNEWQTADKLFREGHQAAYEKEAKCLYGLLRETWERGLEEVLFNGIIERYRPGVQTRQIKTIADITPNDCAAVDTAMTKCSKWLAGHDQAAAARAPVPEPTELRADIEALEQWVSAIRQRRKARA